VLADAGLSPAAPLVAAGSGAFLAHALAQRLSRGCVDWGELCAPGAADRWMISTCAPALAVAALLGEERS